MNYVGIDVSSKELVVALKKASSSQVEVNNFENNKAGHKKIGSVRFSVD